MEPDISILRKTGHFYFALTRICSNLLYWGGETTAQEGPATDKHVPGQVCPNTRCSCRFGRAKVLTVAYNKFRLGEDDGFVAVNKDAIFDVPAHGAR
jgi:hypothetical protein